MEPRSSVSIKVVLALVSFAGRAAAYIDRDIVVGYESSQGMNLQEALQNATAAQVSARRL